MAAIVDTPLKKGNLFVLPTYSGGPMHQMLRISRTALNRRLPPYAITGAGPYLCFIAEQKSEVASSVAKGPNRQRKVTKLLAAMWHSLPEEGRRKYREMHAAQREEPSSPERNGGSKVSLNNLFVRSAVADMHCFCSTAQTIRREVFLFGSTCLIKPKLP